MLGFLSSLLLVCAPGLVDVKREGTAGGFKELDESEVEEARKRRKEFEEKDM
jgi:RNA-binding protein FUS